MLLAVLLLAAFGTFWVWVFSRVGHFILRVLERTRKMEVTVTDQRSKK